MKVVRELERVESKSQEEVFSMSFFPPSKRKRLHWLPIKQEQCPESSLLYMTATPSTHIHCVYSSQTGLFLCPANMATLSPLQGI